jgi:diguanylate cyclase (GGDEF)-like protein
MAIERTRLGRLDDRLANAGLLVLRLERAMERDAMTLIYLDLDGLRLVNDRLGHQVGDRLLARVARRLEAVVRTDSCLGRIRGDEFTVVQPGIGAQQGCVVATRLVASRRGLIRRISPLAILPGPLALGQ